MPRYDARRIESRWQKFWDEQRTFETPNEPPAGSTGKLYVLDMFPYPSGSGLHVGHPEGYTATDIVVRYSRMRGKHVLHPMGWDAFGLPAEEHAVRTGTHPRITTEQNIDTFRRQLKMLGFSYDWTRELATTDPDYYRWTQWIFLQIFDSWYDAAHEWTGPDGRRRRGRARPIRDLPIPPEVHALGPDDVRRFQDQHRLAYISEAPVNWCPALGTVLANEEVIDGKSERGGHPVERLPLRQWMLRITAYADRLGSELEDLSWPESIKLLQRNWIGRSTGAEVDFLVEGLQPAAGAPPRGFDEWRENRSRSSFPRHPEPNVVRVYTTRPDTLFGATYMVLAPEHPLADAITTDAQRAAVAAYREQASRKSDLDRTDLAREKSGCFTGAFAVNPVNGQRIPIWIADYVLISYGTGAIMAVPAHDERDLEFARQFDLPVIEVVQPPQAGESAIGFTGDGVAIHSGEYDGLPTQEFKRRITEDLHARGLGREAVNYRLRDWLFSRQRYWGEPFPIWHELDADGKPTGLMRADAAESLPVLHPHMENFRPTGNPEPMLSKAPDEWLYRTAEDGVRLKRETNSMPQWAGSCWYYLRFADPQNGERFIDPEVEKYWLPVDLYIGGAEHAVLHLLYARFWHKVLFDRGHVSTAEPFSRLVNQGMILGEAELTGYVRAPSGGAAPSQAAERDTGGGFQRDQIPPDRWVSLTDVVEQAGDQLADRVTGEPVVAMRLAAEDVMKQGGCLVLKERPEIVVDSRAFKMSKSRGNVINPDDVVQAYGADSLRLYEMFMGPLEQVKPWSMSGVEGVSRFLSRAWRMIADERADEVALNPAVQDVEPTEEQDRLLHRTIKAVTEDVEKLSFNTAISRMMEFVNGFSQWEPRPRSAMERFALLLSPFAPHIGEELWRVLGHGTSLAYEPWPAFDAARIAEAEVEIPVQVNGKVRGKLRAPTGADQAAIQSLAESDAQVRALLDGKTVVKVIVVPGRMVNFVVK
ncbi:MAG: leucine--tRNA ligase [Planctomyces sp.]|nr:leucine--tRNA ligase [Planctomyces sp.]